MNIVREKPYIYGAAGLLGIGASFAMWRWYTKERIPTEWRDAGVLSDMMCFPVKSCGVFRSSTMECTDMGLRKGNIRDRNFCVTNENGNFVSARNHHNLLLVQPSVEGDTLVLNAPEMESVKVPLSGLDSGATTSVTLWQKSFKSVDCGNDVAKWISKFILNEDKGLRLVYFPAEFNDRLKRSRADSIVDDKHSGAFPDLTSYNLMNESSVDELNTRLTNLKVDSQRFRPNFVIKGAMPYEEDSWQWVKIGDVVFKMVKYCTRCVLTTIDWKTGVKNEEGEPLATLKKYRMISPYKEEKSPVLGVHLVLYKAGTVKVGDKISVA